MGRPGCRRMRGGRRLERQEEAEDRFRLRAREGPSIGPRRAAVAREPHRQQGIGPVQPLCGPLVAGGGPDPDGSA
eukprot:5573735-Alexandrium_andersonii.AAC.1